MTATTIDITAATAFLAGHGRQLERRRLALLLLDGDPGGGDPGEPGARDGVVAGVLAALDAYRNADGGYGWGLEPDLRSAESQPTAGMHAFEVLAEVAPATSPHAVALCDWLERHTTAEGGLPWTLPVGDPTACAPWWLGDDHTTPSLAMTAQVAAQAHRVARHDPAVAAHPWLATATRWCVDHLGKLDEAPVGYELLFALAFLDAAHDAAPEAPGLLDRMAAFVPGDGVVPVPGADGEVLRLIELAHAPGSRLRRLFTEEAIAADLERLTAGQQDDGGWTVDFPPSSPASALEWRAYATVEAIAILRRAGRGA
jgi:hypothetical protein